MAAEEKWYFTKEQLANTPSRRCGCEADKELSNRQQAANFIQDMGQRLQVTQLCINTAIVYMHRFYVYHSFTHFHRNAIATAALFLAAKVEEQPRKLEHVIKVAHVCLHREPPPLDTKSDVKTIPKERTSRIPFPIYIRTLLLPDNYLEQAQDLVFNENVLLQTLSFDVAIDHPHTHVVRCCHMVKASKDLAQTSYFMASNSLHLTTMCLQYKPTVVACFCIHLACKWSNWEIPQSNEGKDWFSYVDKSVTYEQLEMLTTEFIQIFDKCPTKLKRKIMSITASQNAILPSQSSQGSQLFDNEPRKIPESQHSRHPLLPSPGISEDGTRKSSSSSLQVVPPKVVNKVAYDQYKEKKEKERLEREKQTLPKEPHRDGHHHRSSSHPQKLHPPGIVPPSLPPGRPDAKMAPPNSSYFSNRPVVTAARDQTRRDQAHAREMTKREVPQPSPSMFSPQVKPEGIPAESQANSNHVGSSGGPSKTSSQEWPEKLNHNSELDTNRHHSDKYNSLGKDNNRHLDPTMKRAHSKDHRLQVPPGEPVQKPTLEESQRMYNNKYNHRKEGEVKEERFDAVKRSHESDRHDPLKRAPFSAPGQAPKRIEFSANSKKEESNRGVVAGIPNKQPVQIPPTHHASANKTQHRVPSPVVPNPNNRVPSPIVSSRVPHVPRVNPAAPGSRIPNPPVAATSNRIPTPTSSSQHRPTQPNHSQHRVPSPFAPVLQRPKSPNRSLLNVKPQDTSLEMKPQKSVHQQSVPLPKVESRNGTIHPGEDVKRQRDIGHRLDNKLEPVGVRSQLDVGRGLTDAFRNDVQKAEGQRSIEPIIKVESEMTSMQSLQTTPKANLNSSRSAAGVVLPNAGNGLNRESAHSSHRPSSKPKHHTPPSSRKFPNEMTISPVGPMSPEFGSPPPPLPTTPGKPLTPGKSCPLTPGSGSRSQNRNRTTSSSSEPELVPYVKKIEEIPGYENILDTKKGIKLLDKIPIPGRVPDIIQPIRDRVKEEPGTVTSSRPHVNNSVSKDLKPPDLIRPFANQLPEPLLQTNNCDLGAVAFPASDPEGANGYSRCEASSSQIIDVVNVSEPDYIKTIIEPGKLLNMPSSLALESPVKSEHRHKSEKKKKKEKHKHKDKDKKKHKHKDKDRDREKNRDKEAPSQGSAPIKITIPKEKILSSTIETNPPQGLKIKILKDRIKGPEVMAAATIVSSAPPVVSSGGLKLKISKDIIETYTTPMATKESRKRAITKTPEETKPVKSARVESRRSSGSSGYKQNGVRGGQHKMEATGGVSKGSTTSGAKTPH